MTPTMNAEDDPYPCVGVCMTDAEGYCLGCGRPPLPFPDVDLISLPPYEPEEDADQTVSTSATARS